METKPLDFNGLVLQELRNVQTGLTQLTAESEHILKQLTRVESTLDKLEARDDAQQKALDALTLMVHRAESALTAVSGTASDNARRVQGLERQYQGLTDSYMQINRRILDCERETAEMFKTLQVRIDGVEVQVAATEARADAHRREWEPWAKALRWAALIIGALIVAAIGIWLLRDLATSIVNGGLP
jgi:chromosome segregation ATPase